MATATKKFICRKCGNVQNKPKTHIANRYEEIYGPACTFCGERQLKRYKEEKISKK